jgi:hypothetical protein
VECTRSAAAEEAVIVKEHRASRKRYGISIQLNSQKFSPRSFFLSMFHPFLQKGFQGISLNIYSTHCFTGPLFHRRTKVIQQYHHEFIENRHLQYVNWIHQHCYCELSGRCALLLFEVDETSNIVLWL